MFPLPGLSAGLKFLVRCKIYVALQQKPRYKTEQRTGFVLPQSSPIEEDHGQFSV